MRLDAEFTRAVLAQPDAEAPRLVYADWLDERGDPRGDFIRIQCALHHMPADDARRDRLEAREAHLLAQHGTAWAAPLPGLVDHYRFRRGFVEEVRLSADAFLAVAGHLFRFAPIRQLALTDAARTLPQWLQLPQLRHVRHLELPGTPLGPSGIRHLTACSRLQWLTDLGLSYTDLDDEALSALGQRGVLRSLTGINISLNNRLTANGLARFARLPLCGQLERLDAGDCQFTAAVVRALLAPRAAPRLKSLNLAGNPLHDAGVRLLLRCPFLPRWLEHDRTLDLSDIGMTPAGVTALAESPDLRPIRRLNLNDNPLGDDGIAALCSATLPALQQLQLRACDVGDDGALALAGSTLLVQLTSLDLSRNRLTPGGIGALSFSQFRPWRLTPEFEGQAWDEIMPNERM